MTLQHRTIGGLSVSAVGLGCMNLSHGYGPPPTEDASIRLLNHALDLGVTLFDTAAIYGIGRNERLLGKAIMHRRTEFRLASKCVLDVIDGKRVADARPESMLRTLDAALERLRTDHIDLYYMHRPDPQVPIEESIGALAGAVKAGKIGGIGISEMSAETLRRAHAVHPITAVQSEYSPCVRNPEIAVLEACRELGVGFVAFSPVARGLLTGTLRDADYHPNDLRNRMPRYLPPLLAGNLAVVARFDALAAEIGCTHAQLAIAWVLAQGDHIVTIPGTRNPAYVADNVGALAVTLTPELIARIDAIFANKSIRGARYPREMQESVTTETFPDEDLDI